MTVSLIKGQRTDLTKSNPGLTRLHVGLGWDANPMDGNEFDLDAQAFLLNLDGKVRNDDDFIFYNHKVSENNAVIAGEDNRTGNGDGDDESLKVDLSKIPADVNKIDFTVTIDQYDVRHQNFGMVNNAYIRIVNDDTNEELMRYDLSEDASIETAVVMGEVYRTGSEWKFLPVGAGYQGGLAALAAGFGVNV